MSLLSKHSNKEGEDQRNRRLVTMQVPIKISGAENLLFDGYTTGLNEKGMAGRLNLVSGKFPSRLEGTTVQVTLDLPKERPFDAIEGKILRSEPSWTPGYKYFIAIRFSSISTDDIEYLKNFIQWREHRYYMQERPARSWYLFANKDHRQYGPLTTSEVMDSIRQKAVSNEDLIWSAERGEWVRFSEKAFVEIATVPRRKSWLAFAAGLMISVLIGGGILGYRDGWLDFTSAANGYRDGCRLLRENNLHLAMQRFGEVVRSSDGHAWAALSADALVVAHRKLKLDQSRTAAREKLGLLNKISLDKQDNALVLNDYGDCYYRLDEPEKALDYFLKALEKLPDLRRLHFNIGTTYLRMGNFQSALAYFEKVGEQLKNNPDLFINMGLAQIALGKRREAMENFDKAVFLSPEDAEIREVIAHALETGATS